MKNLSIDLKFTEKFTTPQELSSMELEVRDAFSKLLQENGEGSNFLGWIHLPDAIEEAMLQDIEAQALKIRNKAKIFVLIGIGGSYLGTRAVLEALKPHFDCNNEGPQIVYAGHHLSEDYLNELIQVLKVNEWALTVISKSGTTTEPAVAFRILKHELEQKYGKQEASERIIAITDQEKGGLKELSTKEKYKTYVVPDNVGGRYSVLTPVGLFPLAVAGINIRELVKGAREIKQEILEAKSNNLCVEYVTLRNIFYRQGKKIEILINYDPRLFYLAEWWKQLYGESEGKENKGLFPASASFTSDLHSMGQYIQEGERILFESVLSIQEPNSCLEIPHDPENLDGMNFVSGKRLSFVNQKAEEGTCMAHEDGGVPSIRILIPKLNAYYLGQLIYFYEFSCGVSGYLLDVNPFDQPGVEAYKKNMFKLLGK